MKRTRYSARERVSREAIELGRLAAGLGQSGCKLEDAYWEGRLATAIDRLLQENAEDDLTAALDRLFEADPRAHDELADSIESRAESTRLVHNGTSYDVLLVAAPILTWSRYNIPAGSIPKDVLAALQTQFGAHLVAKDARFALADYLFSPDQLPRTFCDTWQLTRELGVTALSGRNLKVDAKTMPETNRFLSDVRYLIGAIAVPQGAPLFRWNESDGSRETAQAEWVRQASPSIESLMTGCVISPLLADAYHSACRTADRDGRPYSVQASVAFLGTAVGLQPEQLRAVIGPFHDRRLEEYRIGFGPRDQEATYHGVVWPLLGAEDEAQDTAAQIEEVLRACGVTDIVNLDHRFPFEFCDECGVPLYPNAEGEVVHAELPEQENDSANRVLH